MDRISSSGTRQSAQAPAPATTRIPICLSASMDQTSSYPSAASVSRTPRNAASIVVLPVALFSSVLIGYCPLWSIDTGDRGRTAAWTEGLHHRRDPRVAGSGDHDEQRFRRVEDPNEA